MRRRRRGHSKSPVGIALGIAFLVAIATVFPPILLLVAVGLLARLFILRWKASKQPDRIPAAVAKVQNSWRPLDSPEFKAEVAAVEGLATGSRKSASPMGGLSLVTSLRGGNNSMGQRDMMRNLIAKHGNNESQVCVAYASAERRGEVTRNSDKYGLTPEDYARRLWRDGLKKGWF